MRLNFPTSPNLRIFETQTLNYVDLEIMYSSHKYNTLHARVLRYAIGGDEFQKTRAVNILVDQIRSKQNILEGLLEVNINFLQALAVYEEDLLDCVRLKVALSTLKGKEFRRCNRSLFEKITTMEHKLDAKLLSHPERTKEVWNSDGSPIASHIRGLF